MKCIIAVQKRNYHVYTWFLFWSAVNPRVSEVVINLLREVGSTFIRTKVQLATLRKIYFSSLKRQNIEIMKYGSHDYMI